MAMRSVFGISVFLSGLKVVPQRALNGVGELTGATRDDNGGREAPRWGQRRTPLVTGRHSSSCLWSLDICIFPVFCIVCNFVLFILNNFCILYLNTFYAFFSVDKQSLLSLNIRILSRRPFLKQEPLGMIHFRAPYQN